MSIKDRFNAAVNVIGGLPKHGPYQPSNEMKLSFYAFYKQATEGPNNEPKPWTWEVVKRVKWEAWKRLGNMSKEQAMTKYVEELNKIIETMSYTENVADFLKMDDSKDNLNEIPSISPIKLNEESIACLPAPTLPNDEIIPVSSEEFETIPFNENVVMANNDVSVKSDDEDDEFFTPSVGNSNLVIHPPLQTTVTSNGHLNNDCHEQETTTDILMRTILTMRTELNDITATVRKLEQKQKLLSRNNGLFKGLSNQTILFVILWPIFSNLLLSWYYNQRKVKIYR